MSDLCKLIGARQASFGIFTGTDGTDKQAAEDALTPTSGFFFGSTDVDDWYKQDLEATVAQLTPLLAVEGVDFAYQASW